MLKLLLKLFSKYGLSKGAKLAKNFGFKNNQISKASKEYTTFYRGVDKWHRGKMVKNRKFVGSGKYTGDNTLWVSSAKNKKYSFDLVKTSPKSKVLKFEVPNTYIDKATKTFDYKGGDAGGMFKGGLPVEFLKKVYGNPFTEKRSALAWLLDLMKKGH